MNTKGLLKLTGIVAIGFALTACKGQLSEKTPVHPNMNMDQQARKEAQEENNFFADGRSMRQPVEGTVARGKLKSDAPYYTGKMESGEYLEVMPAGMKTKSFLYRGKERYEIYCTPCHGQTGEGNGIIMTGNYGYVPAPSYHIERLKNAPDGEIYSAIANGVRTMPSYATQVPVEDRWAIVAYIRALQESQNIQESEIQKYDVDLASLQEDFRAEQAWQDSLAEARKPDKAPEPTAALGKQLYSELTCNACHSIDGSVVIGPSWQGMYGSVDDVVTEEGETITITKDEEYITESVMNPDSKKPVGFENQIMSKLPVDQNQLKALIEYMKTLSDNSPSSDNAGNSSTSSDSTANNSSGSDSTGTDNSDN